MLPALLRKSDLAEIALSLKQSGGSGFAAPDWTNRTAYLTSDGTWTAYAAGFVQRYATINNPSTPYAEFTMTINGVNAWDSYYAGLASTGLYKYTSPPVAILAGDVIVTSSNGSNITSTLYYLPPRIIQI